MHGDYVLIKDEVHSAPRRLDKLLKTSIVIALLLLLGSLVWLLGVSPFMPFSRIDISGYTGIARERILAAAGITSTSSYVSLNVKAAEKALLAVPELQSARVVKYFPGRLLLILEGRRAVAFSLITVNGNSVPVFFDSQGVVFKIGAGADTVSLPGILPVVSGISEFINESPFLGMRLPAVFRPLFRQLEDIGITSPELLSAVSEVRINSKPFDGFDFIVYPVHRKVRVRISELNKDILQYALLLVDVLVSKDPGIRDLDFRSNIASYIPKEVPSEW